MNGAPSLKWNTYEVKKALKVFGWTMGSAVVTLLLTLVGALDIPSQYIFIVPIVNSVLYAIKEVISDNQHKAL